MTCGITVAPTYRVSPLVPDELPRVMELLWAFKQEGNLPGSLNMELACANWGRLIVNGCGTILSLRADDRVEGALGALLYPDMYDGELVAQELFWYVAPEVRGHGHLLLRAFEEWARANGAKRLTMALMHALMPERLSELYRKMGYARLETSFIKCL